MAISDAEFKLRSQKLEFERLVEARKAAGTAGASSAIGGFFGASLLWLIFGSVFLGIFIKLTKTIPFALVLGLVFVAILVWKGTK